MIKKLAALATSAWPTVKFVNDLYQIGQSITGAIPPAWTHAVAKALGLG